MTEAKNIYSQKYIYILVYICTVNSHLHKGALVIKTNKQSNGLKILLSCAATVVF